MVNQSKNAHFFAKNGADCACNVPLTGPPGRQWTQPSCACNGPLRGPGAHAVGPLPDTFLIRSSCHAKLGSCKTRKIHAKLGWDPRSGFVGLADTENEQFSSLRAQRVDNQTGYTHRPNLAPGPIFRGPNPGFLIDLDENRPKLGSRGSSGALAGSFDIDFFLPRRLAATRRPVKCPDFEIAQTRKIQILIG